MLLENKKKIYILITALLIGALVFFVKRKQPNSDVVFVPITDQSPTAVSKEPIQLSEPVPVAGDFKTVTTLPPSSAYSEKVLQKLQTLNQIIISRNDNDPRLDSELRDTSPEFHRAAFEKYKSIPMENRNERGLITFMIARDVKSIEDLEFLNEVYSESPCLSMENCSSRAASDPHHSAMDQMSMNYPQMAALYQLEKLLDTKPDLFKDANMKDHFLAVVDQASKFPVPFVQKKAEELRARIP